MDRSSEHQQRRSSNSPPWRRLPSVSVLAAIVAIGFGVLLIAASGAYLALVLVARSSIGDEGFEIPSQTRTDWVKPPARATETSAATSQATNPAAAAGATEGPSAGITPSSATPEPERSSTGEPRISAVDIAFSFDVVYPADLTSPRYWAKPEWAGTGPYGSAGLPPGFEFVSQPSVRARAGLADASTIRIPAIDLIAPVEELAVVDDGDGRRYEQPIQVVGHIPRTANPGEWGHGWYFGHLESPRLGEGNVFRRLPEIRELVKHDPVDVILESPDGDFLYRVTGWEIIPKEALRLTESEGSAITLVASFPTRIYDKRLLVTADLLARRSADD